MGKRDLIKRKMVNHYSNLYNMKPMVNNINTEYVPAAKKKKKMEEKKYKKPNTSFARKHRDAKIDQFFGEQNRLFNSLQKGVKPTMSTQNKDSKLAKRIRKNKNANTYLEEEHLKTLEHMNRRIKTIDKRECKNNKKVCKYYEKQIQAKKKVFDKKKKVQMKPPKSDTDTVFELEEMKGTEALPTGGDQDLTMEEREMFNIVKEGCKNMMKNNNRANSDVVSSMDEKFEVEEEMGIPIIKFKKALKGGRPEKYKIFSSVGLNHIIEKEICSDKKINEFFSKFSMANKKFFPNYELSMKVLKQILTDLEKENS
ncbi:unnamed protein product [Moneuplotes crassus]|uniref:Uncharacterized protein n=1 Tax=Euplotes crassus TaxID=5936 RepID=A0AAD1UMP4_EUPCR|nr:unnamed protein product [Moneuplotes crassus]